MKPDSQINIRNFILSKGFDVLPIKSGSVYKVIVYSGDKCLGEGKEVYKTWQQALEQTEINIYKHIKRNE